MDLLGFLASIAYAAPILISPIPEGWVNPTPMAALEDRITFGQIMTNTPPLVLGVSDESEEAVIVTPTPTPVPVAHGTTTMRRLRKNEFTIALVGDSMIDTLGSDLKELEGELRKSYPRVKFRLINRGVGAENIDSGLRRLTDSYNYLGQSYPAVVTENPDIVVIESFGYNPYSYDEGAIDRHWMQLARMRDVIKSQLPQSKVLIAVTIAPNTNVFGDGAPGVNFDSEGKRQKVATIKKYLESTVKFATGEKLPLADAYHPSMDKTGNGYEKLINAGDHIHYSPLGRKLMAEKMVEAIVKNKLLE